jgi:hypothetical protein
VKKANLALMQEQDKDDETGAKLEEWMLAGNFFEPTMVEIERILTTELVNEALAPPPAPLPRPRATILTPVVTPSPVPLQTEEDEAKVEESAALTEVKIEKQSSVDEPVVAAPIPSEPVEAPSNSEHAENHETKTEETASNGAVVQEAKTELDLLGSGNGEGTKKVEDLIAPPVAVTPEIKEEEDEKDEPELLETDIVPGTTVTLAELRRMHDEYSFPPYRQAAHVFHLKKNFRTAA